MHHASSDSCLAHAARPNWNEAIQLFKWVSGGPDAPPVGAFQRYLAEAAGLFSDAYRDLLPMLAHMHRLQASRYLQYEQPSV